MDFIKRIEMEKASMLEFDCMARLNHPNIIKASNFVIRDRVCSIYMPRVEEDMVDAIKHGQRHESWIRDVASAILYLHEHGILWVDVKPDNVLCDGDKAMICDFGLSMRYDPCMIANMNAYKHGLQTPGYDAPEVSIPNMGNKSTNRLDEWGFGCIVYCILHGIRPFRVIDHGERTMEDLEKDMAHIWDTIIDDDEKELLTMTLAIDPNDRCSMKDVFRSSFFRNRGWNPILGSEPEIPDHRHCSMPMDAFSLMTEIKDMEVQCLFRDLVFRIGDLSKDNIKACLVIADNASRTFSYPPGASLDHVIKILQELHFIVYPDNTFTRMFCRI